MNNFTTINNNETISLLKSKMKNDSLYKKVTNFPFNNEEIKVSSLKNFIPEIIEYPQKDRFNYASVECGAKVIAANNEATVSIKLYN